MLGTLKTAHYLLILIKIYSIRQENNNDYICTFAAKVAKYNSFPLRMLKRPTELSKIQNCHIEKQFSDISNLSVSLLSLLLQCQAEKSQVIYFREMLIYIGIKRSQPNAAVSRGAALGVY